jgi:SAM-dependent methyltransferase|tara:strand:- start:1595 stop:2230 length:636 start_codon:yes stop_codon:yes gene_type:complete
MIFKDIINNDHIYLYCGDLSKQRRNYTNIPFIGLSLNNNLGYHIKHDITKPFLLRDNSVDIVQSEDVMEHIEYNMLRKTINEIFRILKPGGLFRLSMPDYKCDILYNRSEKDKNGNIIFDKNGGGRYDNINKKVVLGGHVWFPNYSSVKSLLDSTNFSSSKLHYLHYYDNNNNPITNKIDYSKGYISRTPDHDNRVKNPYRPMSIVVDCYK